MGKTFRRGGNEGGYYSFGKSIRDKRQKGGTNRSNWTDENYENFQTKGGKKHETRSSIQKLTTTQDGTEIESDYEELEFDDASAVDYDLDYTHSV